MTLRVNRSVVAAGGVLRKKRSYGEVVPVHGMKIYGKCGGTAPLILNLGTAVSRSSGGATSRKVAGSIPDGVTGIFL